MKTAPLRWLLTLSVPLLLFGAVEAQELRPRTPHEKVPVRAVPLSEELAEAGVVRRLVVKFDDAARVRATEAGGLVSRGARDLEPVRRLIERHGLRFEPAIRLTEAKLTALEERAARRTRAAQPDLAGILRVVLPDATPADLETVGNALQALDVVEYAHLQQLGVPPPGDIAPTTPDLTGFQGYFGPNPGLDADHAWSLGYRGGGIRFSDCEYGWNPDHEDLNDRSLNPEPGQTIAPGVYANGFDSHGTAVMGGAGAVLNSYGIDGIATEATTATYTEWSVEEGLRRSTCIAHAIADSAAGDVVLLEMQTGGANGGFGPAEYDPTVWNIVKSGTDAGVVVVAAAGNGNENLDSAGYQGYRNRGDSGAIIVGAGTSSLSHNKLSFSTYGSRVDVQAWGQSVFTLGYGGFAQYGGDFDQRYTSSFSGTSSASGLIGPSCAVLQSAAVGELGLRLPPKALRKLLKDTGIPQGSGGNIGPMPDLEAAIDALPTFVHADFVGVPSGVAAPLTVDFTDLSFGPVSSWLWSFGDGSGSTDSDPTYVYTTPGTYTVTLTVTGPAGVEIETKDDYVTVDAPLTITSVDPDLVPSLIPGTGQTVTITGTELTLDTTVELNGTPLGEASFSVSPPDTLTLDMPQTPLLGENTLTLRDGAKVASATITVEVPETPVLQIGTGDPLNTVHVAEGMDVTVAGPPGETHYVFYSGSDLPSTIAIVSLGIGNGFTDLFGLSAHVVGEAGWTAETLPLSGAILAVFYLQSVTLSQGIPIPASNVQQIVLSSI